jgi:hypothetical protein
MKEWKFTIMDKTWTEFGHAHSGHFYKLCHWLAWAKRGMLTVCMLFVVGLLTPTFFYLA